MFKIFILPLVLSVLGHGFLLGSFEVGYQAEELPMSRLYLLPERQLKHAERESVAVKVSPTLSQLAEKNKIWKDKVLLYSYLELQPSDISKDDSDLYLTDARRNFVPEIKVNVARRGLSPKEVLPCYGDIYFFSMPSISSQLLNTGSGEVIRLDGGLKLEYYLQGPISLRGLIVKEVPKHKLVLKDVPVSLTFRFWVFKDGRVNQVIVEQGSGFPEMDNTLLKLVKKWRFAPITITDSSLYQWGIMKVRIYE